MSSISKAMFQVHKKLNSIEVKTDSTATNKSYTYRYLSFGALLCIIRPILEECGLYLDQGTTVIDGKDVELLVITHAESGETTEAKCIINNMRNIDRSIVVSANPDTDYENVKSLNSLVSNLKEDYRSWGAELSYKKRHLLLAKLGLHPGEGDGEDEAPEEQSKPAARNNDAPPSNGVRCINTKQAGLFMFRTNSHLPFRRKIVSEYGDVNSIPANKFSKILEDLEAESSGQGKQDTIRGTEMRKDIFDLS